MTDRSWSRMYTLWFGLPRLYRMLVYSLRIFMGRRLYMWIYFEHRHSLHTLLGASDGGFALIWLLDRFTLIGVAICTVGMPRLVQWGLIIQSGQTKGTRHIAILFCYRLIGIKMNSWGVKHFTCFRPRLDRCRMPLPPVVDLTPFQSTPTWQILVPDSSESHNCTVLSYHVLLSAAPEKPHPALRSPAILLNSYCSCPPHNCGLSDLCPNCSPCCSYWNLNRVNI